MTNVTDELQRQSLLGIVLFSSVTTVSCCVFLLINGTMLFTLRSKPLFCDTCRYVLLYNLLLADTVQMFLSQLLYLVAAFRITLTYPVCGFLTCLANLATVISPFTLVLMSVERFVAVCHPLRHAGIVTVRNTALTIVLVWAFNSLNALVRVLLLLEFEDLGTLLMTHYCSRENMLLGPISVIYDRVYTGVLFVTAAVVIVSSYIGVITAARSASVDKVSARKARNTLLLHLLQLGLSLSSTLHSSLVLGLSLILSRTQLVRSLMVVYVCVILFPRCLSSLIYGLRDQNIRPIFMFHLCCWLRLSVVTSAQKK